MLERSGGAPPPTTGPPGRITGQAANMISATREPPATHHATEPPPAGTTAFCDPEPPGARVAAESPARPAPHLGQKRAPGAGVCPHAGQLRAAREAPHDEQKLPAAAAPHREHEEDDMTRSDQRKPRSLTRLTVKGPAGFGDRAGDPSPFVARSRSGRKVEELLLQAEAFGKMLA